MAGEEGHFDLSAATNGMANFTPNSTPAPAVMLGVAVAPLAIRSAIAAAAAAASATRRGHKWSHMRTSGKMAADVPRASALPRNPGAARGQAMRWLGLQGRRSSTNSYTAWGAQCGTCTPSCSAQELRCPGQCAVGVLPADNTHKAT